VGRVQRPRPQAVQASRLFRNPVYAAYGQRIKGQERPATADFLNPGGGFYTDRLVARFVLRRDPYRTIFKAAYDERQMRLLKGLVTFIEEQRELCRKGVVDLVRRSKSMFRLFAVIALVGAVFTPSNSRADVTYSGSFDTILEGTSVNFFNLNVAFSWTQANFLSQDANIMTFNNCGGNSFVCRGLDLTSVTVGGHPTEQLSLDIFRPDKGDLVLTTFFAPSAFASDGDYRNTSGLGASLNVTGEGPIASAVPEPSTWTMMLLGFVGLGCITYRRKSKPALMAA
jgi:PEP-CTERM motif